MPAAPDDSPARLPLHLIWILDRSGPPSAGERIEALNRGVRGALAALGQAAEDHPEVDLVIRAIEFSNGARWHISRPTRLVECEWDDLTPDEFAYRDAGRALAIVAGQLAVPPMPPTALPPVLVLAIDGPPSDDFEAGLAALEGCFWGRQAIRLAVAGPGADRRVAERFGGAGRPVLESDASERIVEHLSWEPLRAPADEPSGAGQSSGARRGVDAGVVVCPGPAITWRVIGRSVRGAKHSRARKPNRDAIRLPDETTGPPLVVAVADGHGKPRYVRGADGARLAAEIAATLLNDEILRDGLEAVPPSVVKRAAEERLPRRVWRVWRQAVEADLEQRPIASHELAAIERKDGPESRQRVEERPHIAYGGSVVAVLVGKRYILYLQIGDGDLLTVAQDGTVFRPLGPGNGPESDLLCGDLAWRNVRVAFQVLPPSGPDPQDGSMLGGTGPPALILLASDGYGKSFRDEAGFFRAAKDILERIRADGLAAVEGELEAWLRETSEAGSGDDVTVALIERGEAGDGEMDDGDGETAPQAELFW